MKERVINARVSGELYEKILQKAEKYRTTVSSLVRNVVEDSIELYADVSHVVGSKIDDEIKKQTTPLGFQEIIVTTTQICPKCKTLIKKNQKGYLEILSNKIIQGKIFCAKCFKKIEKNN